MTRVSTILFLFVFAVSVFTCEANGQTTAFTYQGQLQNSSAAANGNFDFEFLLFDSLSGGSQIGATLSKNAVAVANGSFAVKLDFGSQFPGANRFLEIHIRPSGGGAFTTLTPRQAVASSPYSVKSIAADSATNATQLGGVPANQYVLTGDTRLTDARSPTAGSSNYIQNGTAQQTASNFNISGSGIIGGNLTVNGTLNATASNALQLGGLAANQYVLTGDARLSDARAPTSGSANYIQNTTSQQPSSNFTISGNGFIQGFLVANSGVTGRKNSDGAGVYGGTTNSSGSGVAGYASASTGATNGVWGISDSTSGKGVYGSATASTGAAYGVYGISNSTQGVGVYGYNPNGFAGYFNSGSGAGLYTHSTSGYGIQARSENTHALYADGSIFVNRWIVLQELPGSGSEQVCRNASNILSMCSSSLRYKQNIDQFPSGLSLISRLRPIKFDWKADGKHDLGLGAEDVEKIEPLLVTYNKNGQVEGVKYDRIGVVLINAVKEQQAQIEQQQKQIAALTAANAALNRRLNRLEIGSRKKTASARQKH